MILEKGLESIILDKPKLLKLHPALQRRLLRRVIKEFQGGCYGLPALHTFSLLKIITRDNPEPASIDLPGGLIVKSDKNRITIRCKKKPPFHLLPERALEVPGNIHLPEYNLTFIATIKSRADIRLEEAKDNRFLALFDFHKLNLPLKVRTRNLGDRFRPLGMGGSKKLKEFFIDYRVPREERDKIPLVVSGADILWVVGFQINDRVKISSFTTTVLEMRALSAENGQND
jgi:tRNA(Ile)-lysidine synthase